MAQTIKLKRSATAGNIPSTSNIALGEVAINTTDGKLFIKRSVGGTESIVEVGSTGSFLPLSGGTLTGNLSLGDNDKATFGAGDDLQIYHDGSNSYVQDSGEGSLILNTTNGGGVYLYSAGETMATFNSNGAVNLYHDNALKIATTSTGIDVTGTATMDTLTSSSTIKVDHSGALLAAIQVGDPTTLASDTGVYFRTSGIAHLTIPASGNLCIDGTSNQKFANFSGNGDISFYEDTGSTPKFFWDASAERLGIRTSSPTATLDVASTSFGLPSTSGTTPNGFMRVGYTDRTWTGSEMLFGIMNSHPNYAGFVQMKMPTDYSTNRAFLINPQGGNVGIGTSSPSAKLSVSNSGAGGLEFTPSYSGTRNLILNYNRSTSAYTGVDFDATDYIFYGSGSERMRIDGSSGNVMVGKTDSGTGNAGIVALASGRLFATTSSDNSVFNRLSTDGSIVDFRKNSATVGSIGVIHGNNLFIGAPSHSGLQFGGSIIYPTNGTVGNATNGAVDLGGVNTRFKDLYLSGKANTGSITTDNANTQFNKISRTGAPALYVQQGDNTNDIAQFRSGNGQAGTGTQRVTIQASGNLLVGQTTISQYTNTAGTSLRASGFSTHTRDGGDVLLLNRLTSDGSILQFRKNNSTVGSIGVVGGDEMYIASAGTTAGSGLRFQNEGHLIYPTDGNGDVSNGDLVLGDPNFRFKDLYLSGNATAQKLTLTKSPVGTYTIEVDGTSTGQPNLIVKQSTSERLRIDNLGNLLVAGTNTNPVGNNVVGHALSVDGRVQHSITGNTVMKTNQTTQGVIAQFRVAGSPVGSIFTGHGASQIGIGINTTGITFNPATRSMMPADPTSTTPQLDATLDIGHPSVRWKDLYLSGTANANKYAHDGDSDTYFNFPAANQLSLVGGGAEIVRAYRIAGAYGVLKVNGSGSQTYPNFTFNGDDNTGMYRATTDTLAFTTGGQEAVRIDASQNFLVGKTSTANTASGVKIATYNGMVQGAVGTGLLDMHDFYRGTEGSLTRVGHIRTTGTSTSYNTSSDQRLKENIADADDSGSKVDAIQVRKFDWKADGTHQDYGMVAQELKAVAPEAVSGDADSDEMMSVDYSKLVPMLIKEIQSLRQRVAQLEE